MQVKKDFVLKFGPSGLQRLADGTKRATVLSAKQATLITAGQSIAAIPPFATPEPVRVPLRVVELHPLPHLGELPSTARSAGLQLADFTTLPDWPAYQRNLGQTAHRRAPAAAALVLLAPDGPVIGTIPTRWPSMRRSPDSFAGRSWRRVNDTVPIHPADQVHDADRAELKTRLADQIRAHQPDREMVRTLAPVTEALLRSGRCGPASLGKAHQRRLGCQFEPALDWLTTHGLLTEPGPNSTWSRELLADLRINQERSSTSAPVSDAG